MFRTLLEIGVKTSTFAHFCKEMEHGPGRIYLAIGQSRPPIRFRAQGTPRPHTLTLSSCIVRPIPSFWARLGIDLAYSRGPNGGAEWEIGSEITVAVQGTAPRSVRDQRTISTSTLPRDPQEAGSQDPLHMIPRGRDPRQVTGGGSQEPSSRDLGEGAREPVARPGPAPSSLALSTPGSGARRSHDLWGRGCRSEGAGEPGHSGNKGGGSEAGAAAASRPGARPLPSLPVQTCGGAGKTERRLSEPGLPTPSQGFHLRPGV